MSKYVRGKRHNKQHDARAASFKRIAKAIRLLGKTRGYYWMKYLPILVQAAGSIPEITGFISGLKNIFKRNKIWTPEEEAQFDAETEALRNDPAWQVND